MSPNTSAIVAEAEDVILRTVDVRSRLLAARAEIVSEIARIDEAFRMISGFLAVETEKAPAACAEEAEELTPDARLPAWQRMGL